MARDMAAERGAKLTVLHVIEPFPPGWRMDTEPLSRRARTEARQKLRGVFAKYLQGNDRVFPLLLSGHPADAIVRCARRFRPEVLVIATHGRTGLKRFVMGSVAERVVRHAPCPVLVVR
jgi:nucleotide-binding universal stress UspA family protein